MTTVSEVVEQVRSHLHSMHRPQFEKLNGAVSTTATSLVWTYEGRGVGNGAYLALEEELVYVWTTASGSKQATIERGQLGSTATDHADGTIIEINPRFPAHHIIDNMAQEIHSWPDGIFTTSVVTLTQSQTLTKDQKVFELTGTNRFLWVLDVHREPEDAGNEWRRIPWRLNKNLDTSEVTAGMQISTRMPVDEGDKISVLYAQSFDLSTFTTATDLNSTVGLADEHIDILKLGTAWRMMVGQEVVRSQIYSQNEPRAADEVPAGHANAVAQALKRERDQRIADEVIRLQRLYPARANW